MMLSSDQINFINKNLSEWGQKKKCAKKLGIHPNSLSRHLAFRKDLGGWFMPKYVYDQIIAFINDNNNLIENENI